MRSNSATRNLINVFGKISDLNLEPDKLLSIYKIPNHYKNYKRLSLYFGDWRRVEADCLYLRNRKEFEKLLVLSKISNFKVPYNLNRDSNSSSTNKTSTTTSNSSSDNMSNTNRDYKDDQLLECSDFVKNCKFIYFGNLTKFVPTNHLKSLIIPLDLYSDFSELDSDNYNYTYFEGLSDSSNSSKSSNTSNKNNRNLSNELNESIGSNYNSNMYQTGLRNLNNSKNLINFLENMESVDRVLLCADNNNTWTRYHKLLKYS